MNKREQGLFYTGAALYLRLDSDEIDVALARHGLSVRTDSVEDCRDAIRNEYPERYEAGKRSHYRQLIFGDPSLQ